MPGANRNSPTASLASLRPISSLLTLGDMQWWNVV